MSQNAKIALPRFLKLLTSGDLAIAKAMIIASKIYKDFNTPSQLSRLTDVKLKAYGVDDKEERKQVLAALRKAGYMPAEPNRVSNSSNSEPLAGSSLSKDVTRTPTTPTKRKRKQTDVNEFLPEGPSDEDSKYDSMEFNEVIDEEVLKSKATVINRAPLMTAWATVVAERQGFLREEALSIASVYTEINAMSKGVSIGLFPKGKEMGLDAIKGGPQPYVELMGRRIPLYRTQNDQWRALSNNSPSQASTAFSYISRSLRQTAPYVIGALRLLALSYTPQELNSKGWSLYADFRPSGSGWGERSEVRCSRILELRKASGKDNASNLGLTVPEVQYELEANDSDGDSRGKRQKT